MRQVLIKDMSTITPVLKFFLHLAKAQAVVARRFDGRLGGGLGFTDFMILYHLSQNEGGKLRRVDLADKVGLTASGVTRLLAPMEKIGLVKREADEHDARVSYVLLAPGGKRLLEESLERAEMLAEDALPMVHAKKLEELSEVLVEIGGTHM